MGLHHNGRPVTKKIGDYPVSTYSNKSLVAPVCIGCKKKLKKGEKYHSKVGRECHVGCIMLV